MTSRPSPGIWFMGLVPLPFPTRSRTSSIGLGRSSRPQDRLRGGGLHGLSREVSESVPICASEGVEHAFPNTSDPPFGREGHCSHSVSCQWQKRDRQFARRRENNHFDHSLWKIRGARRALDRPSSQATRRQQPSQERRLYAGKALSLGERIMFCGNSRTLQFGHGF